MSSSNCCFLTCLQISQEAAKVVWYSHLFNNFPQLAVIHTVKGFGIVSQGEIDVFLELSCSLHDPADVGNLILVPLPFLKPAWTTGSSQLTYCWSLAWRILSITLLALRWMQLCGSLNVFWHCLSLGLEWKLIFSSLVATAEFSKFSGTLSAALSQPHSLCTFFWIVFFILCFSQQIWKSVVIFLSFWCLSSVFLLRI